MSGTIHVAPELAARAEALFLELGLDLDTAVSLFLRQSLREQGLPFTLRLPSPVAVPDTASPAAQQSELPTLPAKEPDMTVLTAEKIAEEETVEYQQAAFSPAPHDEVDSEAPKQDSTREAFEETAPLAVASDDRNTLSELRQAFLNMQLIGTPLRRVRTLNRLYAIGESNSHVHGWREVYVSGDEPFALDFGSVRVELGYHGGGSMRMMDGRLPDEVLEADAVFPRDLSAVFSSVIGQRLADVTTARVPNSDAEQLRLRFANGCTLIFMPGEEWAALWLTDAHGSVLYAPDTVWMRVLGERSWQGLR